MVAPLVCELSENVPLLKVLLQNSGSVNLSIMVKKLCFPR
jgi:hypothetical protein